MGDSQHEQQINGLAVGWYSPPPHIKLPFRRPRRHSPSAPQSRHACLSSHHSLASPASLSDGPSTQRSAPAVMSTDLRSPAIGHHTCSDPSRSRVVRGRSPSHTLRRRDHVIHYPCCCGCGVLRAHLLITWRAVGWGTRTTRTESFSGGAGSLVSKSSKIVRAEGGIPQRVWAAHIHIRDWYAMMGGPRGDHE